MSRSKLTRAEHLEDFINRHQLTDAEKQAIRQANPGGIGENKKPRGLPANITSKGGGWYA